MSVQMLKIQLINFAKNLRSNSTSAEERLWWHIRNRQLIGLKFRRQVPIGTFIVDFLCYEQKLIVEVDGGQHADSKKDQVRDIWLKNQGYRVLRFWNVDVLQNTSGVLETIIQSITTPPHPRPLPRGERE